MLNNVLRNRKWKMRSKIDPDSIVYDLHEYGVNIEAREVYLHKYIHTDNETTDDAGIDYRMAVGFVKNLRLLDQQSHKPITIVMQSRGGDWNDGMAIYDAIAACKSPTMIIAYAHARSMTSIILQAANKRILTPNCDVVIHHGWLAIIEDRVAPVMSQIDHEKRLMERMLKIYAKRCKGSFQFRNVSEKEIMVFIANKLKDKVDWIMTAKEAISFGFADGILK